MLLKGSVPVDSLVKMQILLYWSSVGLLAISTFCFIAGMVFRKDKFIKYAIYGACIAFIPCASAFALRAYEIGNIPMWGVYEVYTSYALAILGFYLIVIWRWPSYTFTGVLAVPLVMFMIGIGVLGSKEIAEIPRTFSTFWLYVHIAFAKLSYGGAIVGAGIALFYLLKSSDRLTNKLSYLEKLPDIDNLDNLYHRFNIFTFINLGLMMLSGAIWAYKAWGRYWSWDPIETWALISWLVYGLYVHMRFSCGWHGTKGAYLTVFALFMVIFSFFGLPFFYETVHEHLKYSMNQ